MAKLKTLMNPLLKIKGIRAVLGFLLLLSACVNQNPKAIDKTIVVTCPSLMYLNWLKATDKNVIACANELAQLLPKYHKRNGKDYAKEFSESFEEFTKGKKDKFNEKVVILNIDGFGITLGSPLMIKSTLNANKFLLLIQSLALIKDPKGFLYAEFGILPQNVISSDLMTESIEHQAPVLWSKILNKKIWSKNAREEFARYAQSNFAWYMVSWGIKSLGISKCNSSGTQAYNMGTIVRTVAFNNVEICDEYFKSIELPEDYLSNFAAYSTDAAKESSFIFRKFRALELASILVHEANHTNGAAHVGCSASDKSGGCDQFFFDAQTWVQNKLGIAQGVFATGKSQFLGEGSEFDLAKEDKKFANYLLLTLLDQSITQSGSPFLLGSYNYSVYFPYFFLRNLVNMEANQPARTWARSEIYYEFAMRLYQIKGLSGNFNQYSTLLQRTYCLNFPSLKECAEVWPELDRTFFNKQSSLKAADWAKNTYVASAAPAGAFPAAFSGIQGEIIQPQVRRQISAIIQEKIETFSKNAGAAQ